ncbi:serine/threonine protein kinase [Labilithrix luteola]|uniref:non-specific serine/threonine protein kinase n=1 Tax=Labilithrix luteola TaxID=1391654 RepID=A0A0K1Q3M5_9BACT|nr:serine/threonine protein kinase [Labilithrix luteola]
MYLAQHELMQKRVAVKLLHADLADDTEAVARFRREAEASSHLEHPNVVAATDFGRTDDGQYFLVMDYVEGTLLRAALAPGPLSTTRALRIARQIALALGRAHRAGIVHRDIKPENIMLVRRDDDPEVVKVLDFGIARVEADSAPDSSSQPLTRAGSVLGTPEYMSPEQAVGEAATAASDLYALGIVLYEMLAGVRPFDGDASTMMTMHLVGQVPTMAERAPSARVPPAIEAFVHGMLEKDRAARPASAEAVVEAIDELARAHVRAPAPEKAVATAHTGPTVGALAEFLRFAKNRSRELTIGGLAIVAALVGALVVTHFVRAARTQPSGLVANAARAATSASPDAIHRAAVLGIPALEDLSHTYPEDVAILRELAFAYDGAGRPSDALRVVERAANGAKGPMPRDLVRIIVRAASKFDSSDEAFRLLEGPLGQDGVEALLELSSDTSTTAETRERASRSLTKPSVRKNASESTGFLLDLKAATSCESRRQLLGRGVDLADARALPALRALRNTHGCGRHGTDDCHKCLRSDPSLERAIRAAGARAAQ